jgi:CheY-like chemotaxis protein
VRFEEAFQMADLRDPTILLVEDNGDDVLLLTRAFRKARIANPLNVVKDGEEAIKYLSGDGAYADRSRYSLPFLVLLDLRLPKLSGFEVLAWIRDQSAFAELIVVVLTASDHAKEMSKARQLGANCYLVKPRSFEDIVEMVKGIKGDWLPAETLPEDSSSTDVPCVK